MDMKTKLGIALLTGIFLLVFSSPVYALEEAFRANMVVYKDYSVELYDIVVLDDTYITDDSDVDLMGNNVLYAELFSDNSEVLSRIYFDVYFFVWDFGETNESAISLNLPYSDSAEYLKIYKEGEEKLSIELKENLCDNNGICSGYENYYSCPSDCSIYSKDGICASVSMDGGCDPDCPPEIDIDCSCNDGVCQEWESYKYCKEDCRSGGEDNYCDGVEDRRCDPDCEIFEDTDCSCPDNICQGWEDLNSCSQDCSDTIIKQEDIIYWTIVLIIAGAIVVGVLFGIFRSRKKKEKWEKLYRKIEGGS